MRPAQQVHAERGPGVDWRDAAAYAPLLDADRSLFAWEWLRRDCGYRIAAEAWLPDGGGADRQEARAFGLVAFEDPRLGVPFARPLWRSQAHACVVRAHPRPALADGDSFDLERLGEKASLVGTNDTEHLLLSNGFQAIRLDGPPRVFSAGPVVLSYEIAGIGSAERPLLALRRFPRHVPDWLVLARAASKGGTRAPVDPDAARKRRPCGGRGPAPHCPGSPQRIGARRAMAHARAEHSLAGPAARPLRAVNGRGRVPNPAGLIAAHCHGHGRPAWPTASEAERVFTLVENKCCTCRIEGGPRLGNSRHQTHPSAAGERRKDARFTLILRVGVLEQLGRSSLCLVKNISGMGVQLKCYTKPIIGGPASIRVADEPPVLGRIVWFKAGIAGMNFFEELDTATLLRVQQKLSPNRRRAMPRVEVQASAILRTGGKTRRAVVRDISSVGARVCTGSTLKSGDRAIIEFADLPALHGFVRWSDGDEAGLAFETPIPMQILAEWVHGRVPLSA